MRQFENFHPLGRLLIFSNNYAKKLIYSYSYVYKFAYKLYCKISLQPAV